MENEKKFSKIYLDYLDYMKKNPDELLREYRSLVENPERVHQIYRLRVGDDGKFYIDYYVDKDDNPCPWGPKAEAICTKTVF